ncbi:MAG TPA: TylF/MycF/NovP-related O-methyltransferase [Verrucomicrobiae bacterium]|nr:TylF/MycF/NovP-related O-methyltransferase [Verrucomicrobiae bacterium]
MTKRRITEQEQRYYDELSQLTASCPPDYVAEAPFLFANRIQVTQLLSRIELFKMVMDVPGAIVECGVYRGNALMLYLHLSIALEPYAINRSLFGFDTFEGFRSIDAAADPNDVDETTFSKTNAAVLRRAIEINDLVRPVNRIPRCEIVQGDIVETVPAFVASRPELCVAMLVLDTDLYQPTKTALEHFLPRMPRGGVVVLDEACYRNFPGETQALREVLDLNRVELKRLPFDTCTAYFRL